MKFPEFQVFFSQFLGLPAGFGALLEAVQVVIPEPAVELVKTVTWGKKMGFLGSF